MLTKIQPHKDDDSETDDNDDIISSWLPMRNPFISSMSSNWNVFVRKHCDENLVCLPKCHL